MSEAFLGEIMPVASIDDRLHRTEAVQALKVATGAARDVQEEWTKFKRCADSNGDEFFPEKENKVTTKAAKQICNACVVREECLEDALSSEKPLRGVFGGLDTRQRNKILRGRPVLKLV